MSGRLKGLPPGLAPTPLDAIGGLGWSLLGDDLPSAVAVLRDDALAHNRAWMRRFCAVTGCEVAPHAKTTMSPELFALQAQDGAWGLTVATIHQAREALEAGTERILVANQVVTRAELAWLAQAARRAEIHVLADSVEVVEGLASTGAPLRVLVEVGYPGGRTGCRSLEAATVIARAVAKAPTLELSGIEAYEGLIGGEARVEPFLETVTAVAESGRAAGWFGQAPLLTAGGTSFPDLVARRFGALAGFRPLLRSGCYLTGDHGIYAAAMTRMAARDPELAGEGLVPALEVWASVLSRPESGRVILAAGKRDIGIDAGFPVPLRGARAGEVFAVEGAIVEVNDQHAHLVVQPDCALRVGDRVALGITHPCTTFDRWRVLLRVDEAWRVTGAVSTRFG